MTSLLVTGTLAIGTGLFLLVVALGRSLAVSRGDADILDAIADETDIARAEYAAPFMQRLLGPALGTIERLVRVVMPSFWIERVRTNAMLAGYGRSGTDGLLASKLVSAACGAFLAFLVSSMLAMGGPVLFAAMGGILGFFMPDVWVAHRAEERQEQIRRELPEALDLLAIAVGAGMGLEQAIELVARRLQGALGSELHRMLQEVQLGASRRDALAHLRARTAVTELATFTLALSQADALGSPISEVLRIEAENMRTLRRQRAREYAAKVPVKLLFPLLACIFPALMVVIIGPAVVQILKVFGG